ncbi:MAG: Rap1a/Tai family immunity protein [Terriglobales bacterium]
MKATLFLAMLLPGVFADEQQFSYMDGNRLLQQCDEESRAFCSGYVAAAMDSNNTFLNSMQATMKQHVSPMYCLPKDGIDLGQAVRIIVKWLHNHPEKLHLRGDTLVWESLRDAFPCK